MDEADFEEDKPEEAAEGGDGENPDEEAAGDDEDGDAFGEVFEADAGVVLAAAEGEGCSRGGVEGISLR